MKLSLRHAVAFITEFHLPHKGIHTYQILSRGSAALIQSSKSTESLHVAVSKHVSAPWLFPNYYPEQFEWLQHIFEPFVRHAVQIQDPVSGQPIYQAQLPPKAYLHPTRDVAVFQMQHASFPSKYEMRGSALDSRPLELGDDLQFCGHELPHDAGNADSALADGMRDENASFCPAIVDGQFSCLTRHGQSLASTSRVLTQGMCGGPVMRLNDTDCVGLIEGIVPPQADESSPVKALEGYAAFISAGEISQLIHDIENYPEETEYVFFGAEIARGEIL